MTTEGLLDLYVIGLRLKKRVRGEVETWPQEEVDEWLSLFELEREANAAALEAEEARRRAEQPH